MDYQIMRMEEFQQLSKDQKLQSIIELHNADQSEEIIDLLLSVGFENLDGKLLAELAKAYNNQAQPEEAKRVLDRVLEEDRDAVWYYRYGFTCWKLSENLKYDFETESKKALYMLDKATALAKDQENEIIEWCIELVRLSDLKKVLEDSSEKYPLLYKYYFSYVDKSIQEIKKLQRPEKYKKMTVQDIQKVEDSWEVIEPVYAMVNIDDSYEKYLESAKSFTLEQRYLLAIIWYFIEVNNGGHHQFFFNSTGIVWEDTLNGFRLFGMNHFANNFEKVIDYFGGKIPLDREERLKVLKVLEAENKNAFYEMLEEADDFVYDYDGEETELDYIQKNPEKFLFEGYYHGY